MSVAQAQSAATETQWEAPANSANGQHSLFVLVDPQKAGTKAHSSRSEPSSPPGEGKLSRGTRALLRALQEKDTYTWGHSMRVTALAMKLVDLLGVELTQMRRLWLAGCLHDIGKIALPAALLNKQNALRKKEVRQIRSHAPVGAELIRSLEKCPPIARSVRHHHERWDGAGYPDRLAGQDIPFSSRILGVADAFDAMASCRPYRDKLDKPDILREFREGRGNQFDPQIADCFLEWYEQRPPGSIDLTRLAGPPPKAE